MVNGDKAKLVLDLIMEEHKKEHEGEYSIQFILNSDEAEEIFNVISTCVPLSYDITPRRVIDILDCNEFITMTICIHEDGEEELFIDSLIKDGGEQFYVDADKYFIDNDLLDVVDKSKLLCGDIHIMYYEDEDGTEELLDDITGELIESLLENDDECVHCKIKGVLREVYEIAYQDAIIDMED